LKIATYKERYRKRKMPSMYRKRERAKNLKIKKMEESVFNNNLPYIKQRTRNK